MIKKALKIFIILLLVSTSFVAGILFSSRNYYFSSVADNEMFYAGEVVNKYLPSTHNKLSRDVDFNLFWDVWENLTEAYVDKGKLNEKEMFYGAIRGMVDSLGDPYTVFMEPKVAKEFDNDLAGTFEGIGAEIGIKDDILTIIAPLPEMPAEKAGLKSGDIVLAINGTSTMGIRIDEAVSQIRGPRGTDVVLNVIHDGASAPEDVTITRGKIVVKSIRTEFKEDENIFVVKISNFNDDTKDLFDKAVKKIISLNPDGIIIDLRNNPGGYLETAVEMASEWVEDGVVVSEKFTEDNINEYQSRGRARLKDFKTVVLVNQGSASASEIVSGALQDYKLATIVGKKTFGKGSVQSLNKFSDGSSVKITVAKWLTPYGRSINDEGIIPDIKAELSLEDYNNNEDPQMSAAVDILLDRYVAPVESATSTKKEIE